MECNTCHGEIPEGTPVCPHCGSRAVVEAGRLAQLKKIFSDRYNFIRLLGSGGFAEVYLALDKMLEREVAIKILLPQHAQDPQTVERFLREARLYAKLEHKNIIPIYDTGILEGHVFITMKYIRGESLKHVLFAQKRIAPGQLPGIISGIAQALSYIHRQGIVHRDIKPANIIVEKASRAVYLADFGIARAESSQTLTQTGMIVGTPFYLSPEQIQGKKIDPRSDIYSLGATLYELVTGEPPFKGDSPLEILYQHINQKAKSLAKMVPQVDPVIERIISRCIQKDPARRFQKAEEIVAELGEQSGGFPAAVFEKTVLTAGARLRPARTWKILIGLALLAGLACAAYFLWLKNARPAAVQAEKNRTVTVAGQEGAKPGRAAVPAPKQAVPVNEPARAEEKREQETTAAKPGRKTPDRREVPASARVEKAITVAAETQKNSEVLAVPGTVQFSSFPSLADVYRGVEKLGNTEQMFEKKFPAGDYLFLFSIPGYQSAEVRITIAAGETVGAHHRFPPFRAFTIIARPFGRVFIDNKEYGDTPQTVKLAYGEHLVRITKDGYPSQERTIRVDADTKNSIFFELSKEEKK